ncbi:MAG: hypothetical protein ACT4OU_05870 [Hyphomicrobium sp.]
MIRHIASALATAVFAALAATSARSAEIPANDYPTVARADYVYACMQVNGPTREVLEKCSCSIDEIAAVLPWADYEEAETIMSVSQKGGESVSWALQPKFVEKINNLKRAQVEGELRCF